MRYLIITLLLPFIILLYSVEAFTCDCVDPNSIPIDETIKKSTAIFIGEVLSIEAEATYLKIKFDVLASYKGINERAYIIVRTAKNQAACGFPFRVGEKYLVFTYGEDGFYTGLCSRTRLLSESSDTIAMLPKPIFSLIGETEEYSDEANKIDALLRQIEKEVSKYKNENLLLKIKDVRIMIKDYTRSKAHKESKCPMIGCPPCPPCPQTPQQTPINQIGESDFSKFFDEYKKANSDKDKLRLLESIMNSGVYLSVSQTISLLKEIDFASNRKKFFTIIKGHISDSHNIYQIYNHLDFQSEKDEAKKILEGK